MDFPAIVNVLHEGLEPDDCGIHALHAYLGVPYTDIIRIAARVVEDGGRHGLPMPVMKRIAELCGAPLIVRPTFSPEDDYGILWAEWRNHSDAHAAVLRNGLVLDRNHVWEWADWHRTQAASVLTRRKKPRAMAVKLLTVEAK